MAVIIQKIHSRMTENMEGIAQVMGAIAMKKTMEVFIHGVQDLPA